VAQKKHQEALNLLAGELAAKFNDPLELNYHRMSLLVTLEHWEDINALCTKQLQEGSTDWTVYLRYIETLRRIKGKDAQAEAEQFVKDRIAACEKIERSPYLALVELQKSSDSIDYKAFEEAIMGYFKQLGTKPACYTDLCQYVISWPEDAANSLSEQLHTAVAAFKEDIRGTARINALMLVHHLTPANDSVEVTQLATTATEQLQEYFAGSDASSAGLVYLAAAELTQAYRQSGNAAHLVVLAAVLEAAKTRDNLNFQYSLILCRVYSLLGEE
jgi:hypothetical protein